MKPIKARTLIPKTAELTNFPEKTGETLITFYYKILRELLSNMEEPCIQVEKMGNFYLKERVMDFKERDYIRMRSYIEQWKDGIRKSSILTNIDEQLERIRKNKEKIQKRKDKRTATIKRQHEFREANKCLEEQKEDTSGVLE